jgi:hypothetical protein
MEKEKIQSKMEYFVSLATTKPAVNWTGHNFITFLFMPYLLSKYNSNCYFFLSSQPKFRHGIIFDDLHTNYKNKKKIHDEIIQKLKDCIMSGDDNDIIFIPLMLIITVFDADAGVNKKKNHLNVIIYRKKTNQFEHFEPHGSQISLAESYDSDEDLHEEIKEFLLKFVNEVNKGIPNLHSTFLSASDICPDIKGLQSLEEQFPNRTNEGFCAAWSMFFTEMVLSNPKYTSSEIHAMIINMGRKHDQGEFLRKMIEGYAIHVNDKLEKYYSIIGVT